MKTFKKYKNRKIYSIEESKYVTQQDIVFISLKEDVQVTENTTGRDVTNDLMLAGFLTVLDSADKAKLVVLAKKLFTEKTESQNLNLVAQEDANV